MNIYYYTRTKRCLQIAEGLAERYGTTAKEIYDYDDYSGRRGYIRAAYQSLLKKTAPINYLLPEEGVIILVFPLWAEGFPPAVRAFINQIGREKIIAVVSSQRTKLRDREGFIAVIDMPSKR
ncbi:MAG: flavodoxin [bacterium]